MSRPIGWDGGDSADTNIRGLRQGPSSAVARAGLSRPRLSREIRTHPATPSRGDSDALEPPTSCKHCTRDGLQPDCGFQSRDLALQVVLGAAPCGSSCFRITRDAVGGARTNQELSGAGSRGEVPRRGGSREAAELVWAGPTRRESRERSLGPSQGGGAKYRPVWGVRSLGPRGWGSTKMVGPSPCISGVVFVFF